jgi:DNA-binding PadR family transcriptional regulator
MANRTNLLQGTLDLLIFKALAAQELHGLGISRRIAGITQGTFQVKPGSLFPALHRMEGAGWLSSYLGRNRQRARGELAPRRQIRCDQTSRWNGAERQTEPRPRGSGLPRFNVQ